METTKRFVDVRPRASAAMVIFVGCAALACTRPVSTERTDSPAAAASSAHVDEAEHAEVQRRFRLPDSVVDAARIRTAKVGLEPLVATLTLSGEVAVDPDRSARISSPIAGRLDRLEFKEGSRVAKGDVLAVVRIPELSKLKAAHVEALARAKNARRTEEREKGLLASHATSERAYLEAQTNAETSEAEASALAQELAALQSGAGGSPVGLTLRAPIAGVVLTRRAVVGQPVTAEESIGVIADLSETWFLARTFEKDLGRTHLRAAADVVLNAYPTEHFTGTIDYLGQEVDPLARTVTARIRLTNRDDLLRLGLFGTAQVATMEPTAKGPVLVVPRSAVTEIAGKAVVFVREPDGDFALHEIVTGASAIERVEIVSGLRAGEQVVVDGVFTLKSVALKGSLVEED